MRLGFTRSLDQPGYHSKQWQAELNTELSLYLLPFSSRLLFWFTKETDQMNESNPPRHLMFMKYGQLGELCRSHAINTSWILEAFPGVCLGVLHSMPMLQWSVRRGKIQPLHQILQVSNERKNDPYSLGSSWRRPGG